jgi:hypothetical protein
VLTDHIREKAFPASPSLEPPLAKIGVVPIFEALRRVRLPQVSLAILSGSLIVIPASQQRVLDDEAALGGCPSGLGYRPLAHDPRFVRVEPVGASRAAVVAWITSLFSRGEVNVLVGTAALLGEGWDAPAVNTLVLASVIGSYVSSNQMRGRAIRTEPGNETKSANIWHLATVLPATRDRDGGFGSTDLENLRRRFHAFAGPAWGRTTIESGLDRLGVKTRKLDAADVARTNEQMCRRAEDRLSLIESWRGRLSTPVIRRRAMVQEVSIAVRTIRPRFDARLSRALSLWRLRFEAWRARRQLRRMASAVFSALVAAGRIEKTRRVEIEVTSSDQKASVSFPSLGHLDQGRCIEALRQIFAVLDDPRYLLRRRATYWAVPAYFAENKERALLFRRCWASRVARCELLFTGRSEGKRHLLRAKEQALLRRFDPGPETLSRWS